MLTSNVRGVEIGRDFRPSGGRYCTRFYSKHRAPKRVLAKALLDIVGKPNHEIRMIGTRHGEKLYETLLSREEMLTAQDMGNYYRISPDLRDLNYSKYVDQGESLIASIEDYNSHNTTRLDAEGMKTLLRKLTFIRALERGEYVQPED